MSTTVLLASDPYGSSLRESLVSQLAARGPGVRVEDRGAFSNYWQAAQSVGGELEAAAAAAARAGRPPPPMLGVLIDSSGVGSTIVANKFQHVAAVACATPQDAHAARASHAANVLCLGGRAVAADDACSILDAFLGTQPGDGLAPSLQQAAQQAAAAIPTLDYSHAAVPSATSQAAAARGGSPSLRDWLLGGGLAALAGAALGALVQQRGRG